MIYKTRSSREAEYDQVWANLAEQLALLREMPTKATEVTYRKTGKTYRQLWDATTDTAARRRLMQLAGYKVGVGKIGESTVFVWVMGAELARRAGLVASGQAVPLPDDDATWERVLAPARVALLRPRPVS
jgi:hypothetical protein